MSNLHLFPVYLTMCLPFSSFFHNVYSLHLLNGATTTKVGGDLTMAVVLQRRTTDDQYGTYTIYRQCDVVFSS